MSNLFQVASVAAFVLVGSACSLPGDGHGGGGLTEAECSAVFQKGYELQGMPSSAYVELLPELAKGCADHDALSRKDYECGIKATTLQEYEACKIVLDFS